MFANISVNTNKSVCAGICVCLPVVQWRQGHRTTIHNLNRGRREWDLVVRTAQCPTLIGHGPTPVVMVTRTSDMACCHLGSQYAGRWAGIGVGVASMVHSIGVMVRIRTMTPDRNSGKEEEMME